MKVVGLRAPEWGGAWAPGACAPDERVRRRTTQRVILPRRRDGAESACHAAGVSHGEPPAAEPRPKKRWWFVGAPLGVGFAAGLVVTILVPMVLVLAGVAVLVTTAVVWFTRKPGQPAGAAPPPPGPPSPPPPAW